MGDSSIEAGEPPEYEEFGVHKLLLSSSNLSGYRDVQFLKNRKKKPWQAKVWRPWARDHISLSVAFAASRRRRLQLPSLEPRVWRGSRAQTSAGPRTVRALPPPYLP